MRSANWISSSLGLPHVRADELNLARQVRTNHVEEFLECLDRTLASIANDEGPLIHGGFTEQEQRSCDSTCKKISRFLAAHADSQQR